MISAATTQNPFVKINRNNIDISLDRKNYSLPVENIKKMFIKKRKTGYFPSFMGILVYLQDKTYKLHIQTKDDNEIRIRIKPADRQHFLGVISLIRSLNKTVEAEIVS